jgi:hypothetical protein
MANMVYQEIVAEVTYIFFKITFLKCWNRHILVYRGWRKKIINIKYVILYIYVDQKINTFLTTKKILQICRAGSRKRKLCKCPREPVPLRLFGTHGFSHDGCLFVEVQVHFSAFIGLALVLCCVYRKIKNN